MYSIIFSKQKTKIKVLSIKVSLPIFFKYNKITTVIIVTNFVKLNLLAHKKKYFKKVENFKYQ